MAPEGLNLIFKEKSVLEEITGLTLNVFKKKKKIYKKIQTRHLNRRLLNKSTGIAKNKIYPKNMHSQTTRNFTNKLFLYIKPCYKFSRCGDCGKFANKWNRCFCGRKHHFKLHKESHKHT